MKKHMKLLVACYALLLVCSLMRGMTYDRSYKNQNLLLYNSPPSQTGLLRI